MVLKTPSPGQHNKWGYLALFFICFLVGFVFPPFWAAAAIMYGLYIKEIGEKPGF